MSLLAKFWSRMSIAQNLDSASRDLDWVVGALPEGSPAREMIGPRADDVIDSVISEVVERLTHVQERRRT